MSNLVFNTFTLSHIGGRTLNEDRCSYIVQTDQYAIWVLADGLGGHAGGALAAQIAVDSVIHDFTANLSIEKELIKHIFLSANQAVRNTQSRQNELSSMSTTLAALFCVANKMRFGHIGDSRIYHFRNNKIIQQTLDHSVSQLAVLAGEISSEEIRYHPERHCLLRALGQTDHLTINSLSESFEAEPGDAFLLCSDGFWECVTEKEMIVSLSHSRSVQEWSLLMSLHIEQLKQENQDNYTAICIGVSS